MTPGRGHLGNNHDLSRTFGKRISIFSHCLAMMKSQNLPDLMSLESKFRDELFADTETVIPSRTFHFDPLKTVAAAQPLILWR